MTKAILVMDMPETCLECQFYKRIDETHFAEVYCCMALRKIMACDIYTEKHYDCPLKTLPEKNKYDVEKYATVDYENNVTLGHYLNKGWNDCIDEVLRGEK